MPITDQVTPTSKREELYKQMESGAATTAAQADDDKNRLSAAKQWVSHFNSVLDLIEGLDEPIKDNEHLAQLLMSSWKQKASDKDQHLQSRLAKLKA